MLYHGESKKCEIQNRHTLNFSNLNVIRILSLIYIIIEN
jgi:hypothetical protein